MPAKRRAPVRRRRRAHQIEMPFPLATPSEPSYRLPEYQARIDTYAMNYFLPAELSKMRSMGFKFVRGEADAIRHALIGEAALQRKACLFTASAYVYDLAHALLLQVQRTVQELVNVPEGLDTSTLLATLYNLRGYKMVQGAQVAQNMGVGVAGFPAGPAAYAAAAESPTAVQLKALSSSDYKTLLSNGGIYAEGRFHKPVRMPSATHLPQQTYPWSVTAQGRIAIDGSIANIIEVCRARQIPAYQFSMAQRANVFTPLGVDGGGGIDGRPAVSETLGRDRTMGILGGRLGAYSSHGYRGAQDEVAPHWGMDDVEAAYGATGDGLFDDTGATFTNVIRGITLPAGQAFGPTSVAGLDEVFRMEQQRDQIVSMLTQWGTTGMGILMNNQVGYADYRNPGNDMGKILGNRPAFAQYAQMNGMGNTCGPGYEALWFTADPSDPANRAKPVRPFDERGVFNPQAQYSTCAPMTRQLRNPGPTTDVMIDRTTPAYQRRAKRRAPIRRRKTAVRRRR